MANKPDQSDHTWRIHLKARPAKTIGYVDAPDAETAIDKAIEEFKIDPRIAERLMAERQP
jgi:hypothetical protein